MAARRQRIGASLGDSGYCRTLEHRDAVEHRREDNAFYKHLAIHHPNEDNNINHFKFTLLETHNQPLLRQTSESCFIHNAKVDIPMNSKAEWHQPTVGPPRAGKPNKGPEAGEPNKGPA